MTLFRNIASALLLLSGFGLIAATAQPAMAVRVDADFVAAQVQQHVKAQLADQADEKDRAGEIISVEVLNMPGAPYEVEAAADLSQITIEADSSLAQTYSNRAIIRVTLGVKADDGAQDSVREFGVPVKIKIEKPVWVVKNQITAGQPLSTRDLNLETRDVSRDYTHVAGRELPLNQYEARVNMRPGDMLDNRKILIPPDVRRFTEVRIILTNGAGMQISVPGTALSDGKVGETIQVRQQQRSRKTFNGQVIDKNRVLVQI